MMQSTSLSAGDSISGAAASLRALVLQTITVTGGATCDEVEALTGMKHQTASARVRELAKGGEIVDSGARRETRSGCAAIVWRAT